MKKGQEKREEVAITLPYKVRGEGQGQGMAAASRGVLSECWAEVKVKLKARAWLQKVKGCCPRPQVLSRSEVKVKARAWLQQVDRCCQRVPGCRQASTTSCDPENTTNTLNSVSRPLWHAHNPCHQINTGLVIPNVSLRPCSLSRDIKGWGKLQSCSLSKDIKGLGK